MLQAIYTSVDNCCWDVCAIYDVCPNGQNIEPYNQHSSLHGTQLTEELQFHQQHKERQAAHPKSSHFYQGRICPPSYTVNLSASLKSPLCNIQRKAGTFSLSSSIVVHFFTGM